MNKYVNIEVAKEYLRHDSYGNPYFRSQACQQAIDVLSKVPAADVAPVRYGCWIADKEDVEWGNYLIRYRCSECKERPHFDKEKYKFILSPYCPNCGAKMDGKDRKDG